MDEQKAMSIAQRIHELAKRVAAAATDEELQQALKSPDTEQFARYYCRKELDRRIDERARR